MTRIIISLLAITCALLLCSLRAVAQDTAGDDLSGEAVRAMGDAVMGERVEDEAAVESGNSQVAGSVGDDEQATQEMRARLLDALPGNEGADR